MVMHMLAAQLRSLPVAVRAAAVLASAVAVFSVSTQVFVTSEASSVSVDPAAAADELFTATNTHRTQVGAPAMRRDADLDALAQRWAAEMAAAGELSHRAELGADTVSFVGGDGWSVAAENVGQGPSAQVVADAFVDSDDHRVNVEDVSLTRAGVGVVVDADGQLWVAVNFTD